MSQRKQHIVDYRCRPRIHLPLDTYFDHYPQQRKFSKIKLMWSSVHIILTLFAAVTSAFGPASPGSHLGRFRPTTARSSPSLVVVSPTHNGVVPTYSRRVLSAVTVEAPTTTVSNRNLTTVGGSWECNEEAECVEVPQCDEESCRTSLDVRIHGEWYDLTGTFVAIDA